MTNPLRCRCLLTGLALVAPLAGQADWHTTMAVPKPLALHTVAFDQANDQVVLYGGNTNAGTQGATWIWGPQTGWSHAQPSLAPPVLREHTQAYDATRRETVVYGGWDGAQVVAETWIWNGTIWRNAFPANNPGARMAEMAYDPISMRVILFGGQDAAGTRPSDTWAWDGTNWTQLAPTQVPPARFDHALATDWIRGGIVMFGGWNSGFLADTWLWNGSDWVPGPTAGPSARSEHKMALSGTDIILFGGDSSAGRLQDTWSWNGNAWAQLSPTTSPGPREEHAMVEVLSAGSLLMFGGWHSATGHVADLWSFQGGQWTELTLPQPIGAGTAAMAHDPTSGISLMFGGYTDERVTDQTWSYANGTWTLLTPAQSPPARAEPAMAFDRVRGEFVLFGGANGSTYYDDTWVFRGGNWQQQTPAQVPLVRWGHAMVFDEARGKTLLFSGRLGGGSTSLIDTWEWDGANWTQLSPTTTPPGRVDAGLVFDAGRGEPILFGGWVSGTGFVNDTWAFRGGSWVQLSPLSPPTARSEHMMAYDRVRECVVLFGGQDGTGRVADTWELTTDWRQRTPTRSPEPREEGVMVFDENVGEIVMALGWDLGHFTDTWHFATRPPATSVAFGAGCSGLLPTAPALDSDRPWLGTSVRYEASGLPQGAVTALLFGLSRANIPLDAIGMPGCVLATPPIASAAMMTSGTSAVLDFGLPNTGSLVGARLVNQVAVLAPGANSLGLLSSNGLELTMAGK